MADVYDTTSMRRESTGPSLHWPSIIAGVFVALTMFIILAILGAALSLDGRRTDARTDNGTGAMIWACIAALIAFGAGGYVAARNSTAYGRHSARLNGAMVWAVVVPLMVWGLGSFASAFAPQAANASAFNDSGSARQASARFDPNAGMTSTNNNTSNGITGTTGSSADRASTNANNNNDDNARRARSAAWGTLISLVLGLVAAYAMSSVATGDRGHRRGMTTTTTTLP
jgi:hypothetical protein